MRSVTFSSFSGPYPVLFFIPAPSLHDGVNDSCSSFRPPKEKNSPPREPGAPCRTLTDVTPERKKAKNYPGSPRKQFGFISRFKMVKNNTQDQK